MSGVAFLLTALTLAVLGGPAAPAATQLRAIRTPAPSWYTPELHAKIMAAGDKGVAIPKGVDIPASTAAFLGIRPGQLIILSNNNGFSLCTSNFVFHSGASQFIGTAGHCGGVGDQVSMVFLPLGLANIGQVVKSTGDAGVGNDFALISIKPSLKKYVSPSMPFWGGPTGPYTGAGAPTIIKHVGWGLGIGTGGTPRIGIGTFYNPLGAWRMVGVINLGDSGSGAEAGNGQAVGNITHISVQIGGSGFVGDAAGTAMQKILQLAGVSLSVCKAIPWPLYGCPKP